MVLFTLLFGVPIYLSVEKCYPIKLFELRMKLMREYMITCKESTKLKMKLDHADAQKGELKEMIEGKEQKMKKIESKLIPYIEAKKGLKDWMNMFVKIRTAYESPGETVNGEKMDTLDMLNNVDIELGTLIDTKNTQLQYKWVALILSTIITIAVSYGVMRLAFFMTNSNKEIERLEEAIIGDHYIPRDMMIDDIVSKD